MSASTFSYAQAAKGLSTPAVPAKATSGSATPSKDAASTTSSAAPTWAEDVESATAQEELAPALESQTQPTPKAPESAQPAETSSISSPDLGASSASTVTKDDDVSSLPNASSESTWDNKSQASTSVEKTTEPVEKTSEKVKKGKNAVPKPLQEAPPPAVNIWKQRAEEQLKGRPQKPAALAVQSAAQGASSKRSEGKGFATHDNKPKAQDEERSSHGRKDNRLESESKTSRTKFSEKEQRPTANALPPPRDQESWPTPDIVVDEDRKKAQEKGEKERKESTVNGSHSKQAWVKVPYTPTAVFSTPLPGSGNTRRGGRSGGRGGAQNNGRSAGPSNNNGATQLDKEIPAIANGEQSRRETAEDAGARDASSKAQQTADSASPVLKDAATAPRTAVPNGSEPHGEAKSMKSSNESSTFTNHNGELSRPFSHKSSKPRRGDFAGTERKRDGEVSPSKGNTFEDRRSTASTQTDAPVDGERRANHYHDGANGQHKQGRFGSYPNGRDRTRGGARGGRASYSNGNQFSNGNMAAMHGSNSMPLGPRSPTTFNPENPSFFSTQGKFGRNGHRSQSITTDPYRFGPYQNGPQVPPLQTYGMYDYNMVAQPMSAMPFANPYVDQYALFAMITTQVDYYFSVDNLLKDMFLRRRMDSQGFVSLDFIAGFNRIKNLSQDIELIKLVCQQSAIVEYRTGEDGQDRLRRKEGWEQWILNMSDRDESARNEGPKELRQPSLPHVHGFDQSSTPQWTMSAVVPPYGSEGPYPHMNGYVNGAGPDGNFSPDGLTNGTGGEAPKEGAVQNGHPIEHATKAVSLDLDCFP